MSEHLGRRAQEVFMVLMALADLGGENRRQDVVNYISEQRWYELVSEDLVPPKTTREARYRIDLAWARKDAVLLDLVNNLERDAWGLNRKGRDTLDRWISAFRSGRCDLRQCEYFTGGLKRLIEPGYKQHATDLRRLSLSCFD